MSKKSVLYFILFLLFTAKIFPQNLFVALDGNDFNTGSIDNPLKTISIAIGKIQLGDTIFVRGGVYLFSSTISITTSKSGTENSRYFLFGYKNERPILDFSLMPTSSSNRGINFKADYWHIKGIDFKGAGDNGMNLSGSHNIIEYCSFYENKDTGLQLSGGASDNQIINCDSYYNTDPSNGNADGFAPKLDVGDNNYFYGCRAWQNSDDGWDGYLRASPKSSTILENCWCFSNGYLKDGKASSGNGNGYKMGGSDTKTLAHNFTLKKCIAFDNRIKGFDQNNNKGSMILLNCSAYRNGTNYSVSQALNENYVLEVKNCIAVGDKGSIGGFAIESTNSWMAGFNVNNDDFISLDTTGVRGPRKPDGSLPDIQFMHLAQGSDLIDAGTDVGLSYLDLAPDLGAFEYKLTSAVKDEIENIPGTFSLSQNYPNPFNPVTVIKYSIPLQASHYASEQRTTLVIYDILGKEISILVNEYKSPGNYEVEFNASRLSSGVYFYRLQSGNYSNVKKLILMK